VEKIHHLAKEFHVGQRVPGEFHITLGYSYKNVPEEIRLRIQAEVQSLTRNILSSAPMPLVFEEPKLCYFQDMTTFIPWTGEYNPF
jgi:hypothetical protein